LKRRIAKTMTVEKLYPSPAGRAAGDAAVDALPMSATLAEAVDAFDAAYWTTTGTSPFRKKAHDG